jgi:hypothetical protein
MTLSTFIFELPKNNKFSSGFGYAPVVLGSLKSSLMNSRIKLKAIDIPTIMS